MLGEGFDKALQLLEKETCKVDPVYGVKPKHHSDIAKDDQQ